LRELVYGISPERAKEVSSFACWREPTWENVQRNHNHLDCDASSTSLTVKGRIVGGFAHELEARFTQALMKTSTEEVRGLKAPPAGSCAGLGDDFGDGKNRSRD